jgi:hypothetical protein
MYLASGSTSGITQILSELAALFVTMPNALVSSMYEHSDEAASHISKCLHYCNCIRNLFNKPLKIPITSTAIQV